MPLYGSPQGPVAAIPGDTVVLFNAETLTAPSNSIALNRATGPGGYPAGIVFTVHFASSPTAVLTIQGSNQDTDSWYQTLWTNAGTQNDYYADQGNFAFYRAHLESQSGGGAVTVVAQR